MAKALQRNREDLKALACKTLSPLDIEALNLGPGVLDVQAARVEEMLLRRGIDIPLRLRASWGPEWETASSVRRFRTSVYYNCSLPNEAKVFYDMGFCDTDGDEPQEWEATLSHSDFFDENPGHSPMLTYLKWLLSQGMQVRWWHLFCPPLWVRSASNAVVVGIILGETIFNNLLRKVAKLTPTPELYIAYESESARILHDFVLSTEECDSCQCHCSRGGCTPFIRLLSRMKHVPDEVSHNNKAPAKAFIKYLKQFGDSLSKLHHLAALRFITFTTLQLRHTCEELKPSSRFDSDNESLSDESLSDESEELRELNEEDNEKIIKLEELLAEFEEHLFGDHKDDECDEKSGDEDDDDHAPRPSLEGIIQFWKGHWVKRINEAFTEIESCHPWDQDKQATEEIGVIWRTLPEAFVSQDSDEEYFDDASSHLSCNCSLNPHTLACWKERIDRAAC